MKSSFLNVDRVLDLTKKPLVMGILNITPDSFSDSGKYFQIEDAIKHAEEMIKQGVDIIDIGGESTKPNAKLISEEEELRRVIPVVQWCREAVKQCLYHRNFVISIDTYKSNVARTALQTGANMINDVSGLTMDKAMVKVAGEANCPIVIMHNKGIPATKSVISDKRKAKSNLSLVYDWLSRQTQYAINNGIKKENIIIDPGIGFGKTPEEDFELIQNLKEFKSLGFPVLVGPSKKSFIKKLFGEERLEIKNKEIINLCAKNGVDIVRIHLC